MYRICLKGGRTFSATTVGGAQFDTQLFLFDRQGIGVYANDDVGSDGGSTYIVQSTLPAGHALTPQYRGKYYLAISAYNNDPVSAGGRIFPNEGSFTDVVAASGPGGGSKITGWSNEGGAAGVYTIRLTGARVCGAST
jgi:hypothetical protein